MPDHTCPNEQSIGALKKAVQDLKHTVYGNGKDGLKIEFERIRLTQETMHEDLSSIRTSMSAIAQSQVESDAIEKERNRASNIRSKTIQKIGIFATIVFGAVGLVYVILDHAANH